MSRGDRRDDRGAVALVVAILAVVLFAVAAMSVDLGNAWARKRDVQTQVDVSALSAGYLLPQTAGNKTQILAEVAKYLNKADNQVPGQSAVTVAGLDDDNLANGEVDFSADGTRMEVMAPEAWVDFGLGQAISDGVAVQAAATVAIESPLPPMVDVLPFWLPSGCAYGPSMADTSSKSKPAGPAATDPPTAGGPFVPGPAAGHTTGAVTPNAVAYNGSVSVSVTIENLPKNSDGGEILFTFDAATTVTYSASWSKTPAGADVTVTVPVDTSITGHPGTWEVWPLVKSGSKEYPQAPGSLEVTGGPSPSPSPVPTASPTDDENVSCASKERGNFGQLNSPRKLEHRHQHALALNIALGLDHLVVPFVNAPSNSCGKRDGDVAGAILDDDPTDGNNCITADSGNDGPYMTKGFVTGIDGEYGRLDAQNGATRTGCGRTNAVLDGVTVNNDVLSCFLRNGHSLGDIAKDSGVTEAMLDPAVVDSPRFVWLPVVYATNRAQKDFQPIKTFVPGFITDETSAATKGASDATAANGVVFSGQLESLQVFLFNEEALPLDERSRTVTYDPNMRSIVRLVN